jgi:RNA polymerase sigma-70 factor, ECF subfamily
MTIPDGDTHELIERAGRGDGLARQTLLDRHRERLRRMVAARLDRRLAARFDPSDVVQEALADATRHLPDYLRDRPLPFLAWLRRLTWERLIETRRRHILARRRSVLREEGRGTAAHGDPGVDLPLGVVGDGTSPSRRAIREESNGRVRAALAELPPRDRQVLVLRYLEQLSTREIAALLGISEGAVMTRHTRALQRLRVAIDRDRSEGER